MTREAKIGMLTGLAVIVLIGMLLATYLDQHNAPSAFGGGTGGGGGATASLGVGQNYRDRITRPNGVPVSAAERVRQPNFVVPAYVASGQDDVPAMRGGPPEAVKLETPVSPVSVGPVTMRAETPAGRGPVFKMPDSANLDTGPVGQPLQPTATSKEYTIVAGDTLTKIVMKFYKSEKSEFVRKIVAANPTTLKDANTTLLVGKKLTIPDVKPTPAPVVADGADRGGRVALKPPTTEVAKKETTYMVKAGDTLGSIAAKYVGTGDRSEAAKMVKKIVALNKIQDPEHLLAGTKLKLPAKS
ncbi:MAG: LysM peptidoglycan-binding domain-containing protein [Phycisphaerales bacterium]|nr:LysM peptidoglycan-binding domain-containing protein [Phycisphaerales bacterium]